MGTRCGALDPGVLLYLLERPGFSRRKLQRLLYEESGLLGVSGISSDMRALLSNSDGNALEAVDLFVYRVGRELGSLAAALGGLDGLVFTGGIGEKAAVIRERICQGASWLGVHLDRNANVNGGARISTPSSGVSVWVVQANEEAVIAQHMRAVLRAAAHAGST
jgi:acetate kinase